ncbi:hypothetical protein ABE61_17895 [Lysinibacillus sphaericus]|uniref:non-ribosomal peptide synthetase n=1 Tax=Lysinibacillus sphaericus TaxID=1421 RepID=UPI0018CF1F3F|nr:non-ribosomal peptide synthetase [Lysinibacillus sphaericus]MBG9455875.1 hypothetical protein [Lysinibacillus sphaericus]MBG9479715.1 hypothetical protein [Lysinibacillus sphaericus]MBG9594448.1 hypothetical protein [Lysinibacillus sphaericus]
MTKKYMFSINADYHGQSVDECELQKDLITAWSVYKEVDRFLLNKSVYLVKKTGVYVLNEGEIEKTDRITDGIFLYEADIIEKEVLQEKGNIGVAYQKHKDEKIISFSITADSVTEEQVGLWCERIELLLEKIKKADSADQMTTQMISDSEKNKILSNFVKADEPFELKDYLIDYLEEHAELHGERKAISFGTSYLTYRELNERANQIAYELVAKGVKPNEVIALMSERSLDMIIGIYGILKAGAAYLPIDLSHPKERISFMLKDAGVNVILTGLLPADMELNSQFDMINVVSIEETKNQPCSSPKAPRGDLAYVIYTSGTTGQPKGVLLKQSGVINLAAWLTKYGDYTEDTKVLQNFNFIFDGSVPEIFSCVVSGCELHILSDEERKDPEKLLSLLPNAQITMVPSMFRELMDYAQKHQKVEQLNSFDHLFLAAEPVTQELIEIYSRLPGAKLGKLHNNYGPTEATVCASSFTFDESIDGQIVPIGKPISNVHIFILNGDALCGIDMIGEICIGGAGVGEGYLNKAEMTSRKFVRIPELGNQRLYRTGDLAYWDKDGQIILLGRSDDQIKINGYRVETNEIEYYLRKYTGVVDALVMIQSVQGQLEICAYYVSEKEIEDGHFYQKLSHYLPDYLMPKHYIRVSEFPKTLNGKIAKQELPIPRRKKKINNDRKLTVKEMLVIEVMEEVLGHEGISIEDNFIALGGDSIKAIRVVSRIRQKNYDISIKVIMKNKILKDIAKEMAERTKMAPQKDDSTGLVPLTAIQKEFFASDLPFPNHFNQSIMLSTKEQLDLSILRQSLEKLTEHHCVLRTVYEKAEDHSIQQIVKQIGEHDYYELFEFDYSLDNEGMTEEEYLTQKNNDIQESITMFKPPLFKASLIKGKKENYLMLTAHHLIVDGVSWRLIIEDLNTVYKSLVKGNDVQLSDKTVSFKTWSNQIQKYLSNKGLTKEIDYWLDVEEKIRKIAPPSKPVTGKVQQMVHQTVTFSQTFTEDLLLNSNQAYATEMNDLLLTSLFRAMAAVQPSSILGVCLEGHGREILDELIEVDRTVGWFTSVYPVAVENLAEELPVAIKQVKEHLRRVPKNGIGYGVLSQLGDVGLNNIKPSITFNYLGEFADDSSNKMFQLSNSFFGKEVHDENIFGTKISINTVVIEKKFSCTFSFDQAYFSEEYINNLSGNFQRELKNTVQHCVEHIDRVNCTPSDFGEYVWKISEFEAVQETLEQKGLTVASIYPLTSTQSGMLYETLKNPFPGKYIVQNVLRIVEDVDTIQLEKAIQLLAKKYGVLRSKIIYQEVAIPRQIKLDKTDQLFVFIDASNKSEAEIQEIIDNDAQKEITFEMEKLVQFTLIKTKKDYLLLFTFHHILMDGWCGQLIYRDLIAFYDKLEEFDFESLYSTQTENKVFEEFTRQDAPESLDKQYEYWSNVLSDLEPARDSLTGPEKITSETTPVKLLLTEKETEKIEQFCHKNALTVSSFFEIAWGILLQKYTFTKDVVFGKVVSGREIAIEGIEESVGLFINTVPVRVTDKNGKRISDLFEEQTNQNMVSIENSRCSLSEIQRQNDIELKSLYEFSTFGDKAFGLPNSTITLQLEQVNERAVYPLTLSIKHMDVLTVELLYDHQKYSRDSILRMSHRLYVLLMNLMTNENELVADLLLLDENEQQQIYTIFNQETSPPENKTSLSQLFIEQVEMYADKPAVRNLTRTWTYKELDNWSDHYAERLKELKLSPGAVIGIEANHNVETIIGILAIIKIGCVYLPIDETVPSLRASFMLEDGNAKGLIKTSSKKYSYEDNYQQIRIESVESAIPCNSEKISDFYPESHAYVMYTSGTTGQPKGVLVGQSSVINLVKNSNYVQLDQKKIIQMGSLSFDASTFEIWGSLLNGGCLTLCKKEEYIDDTILADIIDKHQIDTMFITTALFNKMIELNPTIFKNIEQLYVGGEQISRSHVEIYLQTGLGRIHNIYGPTENTTFSLFHLIDSKDDLQCIPIGKPLKNTKVFLLNGKSVCGVGMIGEICLAGNGLAIGYVNNPELTAKSFTQCELGTKERIYRTGDLGQLLPNGEIVYVGRIDKQIKIRGYRIELNEIKNKLIGIPGIQNSFVTVAENEGKKHIIAYLIGEQMLEVVKGNLSETLPGYMIPSKFIWVDELKLNSNGKVDERLLPEVDFNEEQEIVLPSTREEEVVAGIFCQVLKLEHVSVETSFFELGGHSLQTMEVIREIKEQLNVSLPLEVIYTSETVRNICLKINKNQEIGCYFEIEAAEELEV